MKPPSFVRSGSAALAVALPAVLSAAPAAAQQVADSAFAPDVGAAAYPAGTGPHVVIDGAHHDFHTAHRRYLSFAELLRRDGYRVDGLDEPLSPTGLDDVDVLVIANALHESNALADDWRLPTPSAFTPTEIAAVRAWVERGGALLLIADHMPFPGAAHDLAAAFGFELRNGFAFEGSERGPMVFRRSDGSLADHAVTNGARSGARIDSVVTFTGEAFQPAPDAASLLTFRSGTVSLEPDTAWIFHDDTPSVDVGGWSQGAVMRVEGGRVAVFGEAAMFSAQLAGPQRAPMGMNHPMAAQNPRFLLNVLGWLTRSEPVP
jgi:uncharacterized protein (DUF2249 family)